MPPPTAQESLQRKQAANRRRAAAPTARHRREREAIQPSTGRQITPHQSIYQTPQHTLSISKPIQSYPSPTRSKLPRNMLMEISNNAFLAQANPHPWKKQTSQPWKRLADGNTNTNTYSLDTSTVRDPIPIPDDVFGPYTSSPQSSTTLSQLHRVFKIGPIPPPPSQYQSSNSTTLSQAQRRFGITRQPAVTPFQIDVESPSPTTVRAAARSDARQRDTLNLMSPTRRRTPSPSPEPEPRRQPIANLDGSTEWDDIDDVVDFQIPEEIPVRILNRHSFIS